MGNHGLACTTIGRDDRCSPRVPLGTKISSGGYAEVGEFWCRHLFEFRLHPVGPMLGGILIHRLDKAAEIIRFYDNFTRTSPDELGAFVGFVTSPDGERVLAIFVCYNGAVEEGERILKPLRVWPAACGHDWSHAVRSGAEDDG